MTPFGLDISDAMIRLVVLERKRREWRMPMRAEIPVPEGIIVDGEIKNPGATVDLLRQLLSATGPKLKQAIVALPERHTFIKEFSLVSSDITNLEQAVHDEASQHLPYAWDEVYHDWQHLEGTNALGQHRVLLGAAPKTLVDGYLTVLDQAGIETVRMEVESVAVARATIRPDEKGTHLVLDLGRTRSTIILLHEGVVIFSATIRYAGRELNRFIADSLKITMNQAERAKSIFGLDPRRGKGILKKVLSPQLDILVSKIHEVLDYYQEHIVDHPPLSSIAITGSGALLRGIDQALAASLDRPVTLRPAWIYELLHVHDRQPFAELPYTYATAFGLALENFEDNA